MVITLRKPRKRFRVGILVMIKDVSADFKRLGGLAGYVMHSSVEGWDAMPYLESSW